MIPVTIKQDGSVWTVQRGDCYSMHASWAEMVGQVLSLTNPGPSTPMVALRTKAEHEARAARRRMEQGHG